MFILRAYRLTEIKQVHVGDCCVMQGTEVVALSADYACLLLLKEQQSWVIGNLHERAWLRMLAFCQGYEGEASGRLAGPAQTAIPDIGHCRRLMESVKGIGLPVVC